jgi:hypothetical protein
VIGKFGAESKLRNTITIDPETVNTTSVPAMTNNDLSLSFRKLLEASCFINQDRNEFEKIIMQTSDLCFHLENEHKFFVHQVTFYLLFFTYKISYCEENNNSQIGFCCGTL